MSAPFSALLQELYDNIIWLGFLFELYLSFCIPPFTHNQILWEAEAPEGFEGRSMTTHLLLSAQTYWYVQTGTYSTPGQKNHPGKPWEPAGPRWLPWLGCFVPIAAGRDFSIALQAWRWKYLFPLTRSNAPSSNSHCVHWLPIWVTTDLKTPHKWTFYYSDYYHSSLPIMKQICQTTSVFSCA